MSAPLNKDPLNRATRLYRALARAFPHEFQVLYGEDLERAGEDAAPEIWRRHGIWGLVRLLADIALRLPAEYLSELRADTKYALRMLAKSPGFTAIGIISLTLGIGVCSYFFGAFNGLVLRPLPGVADRANLEGLGTLVVYSYFERYREQPGIASATAFTAPVPFSLARKDTKEARSQRVFGVLVSPEYFSVLGLRPLRGRFFTTETAGPGTAPVVVISERFWRSQLDSDPGAVGRSLRVNGRLATVLGVAPKDFGGVWPIVPADLFVPMTSGASIAPELAANANPEPCLVVLRLAPGSKPSAVEATLDAVTKRLDREKLGAKNNRNVRHIHFLSVNGIAPMPPALRVMVLTYLGVLLGLVLSLACANLANLLLARSSHRRKEIAIRLSVGAGRFRLIRQLLTESVIISLTGGAGGWLLSYGLASHAFSSKLFSYLSADLASLRPDLAVLLFTLAVSALTGIGFGLAPALATTRTDVGTALKQGALTPLRGYRRFGLRNLLVVYEVAGSLTLLLVTGYIVFGFGKTFRFDPGFDTRGLVLFQLDPAHDGYSEQQSAALYRKLPGALSKLSTVRAVAVADTAPFAGIVALAPNARFSAPSPRGDVPRDVVSERIGVNYFSTLGVPLVRGREFSELDRQGASGAIPVVIDETAAREFFATEGPLGRTLQEGSHTYSVIGVARNVKSGFGTPKPIATVYVPFEPQTSGAASFDQGATIIVRGAAASTISDVRQAIASLDPHLTLFNVGTINDRMETFTAIFQFGSSIYGGIGVFGLILACIGLAGVTAYAVARRRKEIGIRMALGARSAQVLRLVLREGAVMVAIGSAVGFFGAFLIYRVLAHNLFSASDLAERGSDPALLVGAPLLLAALAMLACYLPARRAARIDPLTSLRDE